MKRFFTFPNPVNEIAARLVAGGMALLAALALVLQERWIVLAMAYLFTAHVLAGPRLSPLARVAMDGIAPRLPVDKRYVPGPPKRFAQGIGMTLTLTAVVLLFGFGLALSAWILVGLILVFATLEAAFAFCAGCEIFKVLMRLRVIPAGVCRECAAVWSAR
jgi:hypothetical protein